MKPSMSVAVIHTTQAVELKPKKTRFETMAMEFTAA